MSTIVFYTSEGEELYRLHRDRRLRIGRDPSNDVVLRDAKVSRRHAEVVFERGFFVLHDLDSSNGSWVNGRRIRVAPLTDGAELKIGNSYGRFSEELEEPRTKGGAAVEPGEGETRPHQPGGGPPADAGAMTSVEPRSVNATDEEPPEPQEDEISRHSRFMLDRGQREGVVRVEEGRSLFRYFAPRDFVRGLGVVIVAMIVLAGIVATAVLAFGERPWPAAAAAALTTVFAIVVASLVPRRCYDLYSMRRPRLEMSLREVSPLPTPTRFTAYDGRQRAIAQVKKSLASVVAPRRWLIEQPGRPATVAWAVEEPLVRALLRKLVGSLFGTLDTQFRILMDGTTVGLLSWQGRSALLDLSPDPDRLLDRRLAVALAIVIDSER